MNTKWSEMNEKDKALLIARLIFSVVAVVFAILQLTDVWKDANMVAIPSVGVVMLLQAIQEWNIRRRSAIFGFWVAGFIFACTVMIWGL